MRMVDRFGKPIFYGYTEKEDMYLRAIIEMGVTTDYLKQFCELTGRSLSAVRYRVMMMKSEMESERRLEAARNGFKALSGSDSRSPTTRVVANVRDAGPHGSSHVPGRRVHPDAKAIAEGRMVVEQDRRS